MIETNEFWYTKKGFNKSLSQMIFTKNSEQYNKTIFYALWMWLIIKSSFQWTTYIDFETFVQNTNIPKVHWNKAI